MATHFSWKWLGIAGLLLAVSVVAAVIVVSRQPHRGPEFRTAVAISDQPITQVAYSPDGKFLITAGVSGRIVAVPVRTLEPKRLAQLTDHPITALAISVDGFVGAGDATGQFLGWQLESSQTQSVPNLGAAVASIAYPPSPTLGPGLLLGLSDGRLIQFSQDGPHSIESGHRGSVRALAFVDEGKTLVTGGSDGQLNWRNASDLHVIQQSAEHFSQISCLASSNDGRRVASADWNGVILVWDIKTRKVTNRFEQPDGISGLGWIGDRLVSSSWDGRLRFWGLEQDTPTQVVETGSPISAMAISPSGETIAIAASVPEITLWRVPL